jgi:hypothetical protein
VTVKYEPILPSPNLSQGGLEEAVIRLGPAWTYHLRVHPSMSSTSHAWWCSMNRRNFLGLAAAAPIAAVIAEPILGRIFLPPRGGWPALESYTHQTIALGYTIAQDSIEVVQYGHRLVNRAEWKRLLMEGLDRVFRDAYDGKLLDQDGNPIPGPPHEWAELFA